MSEIIDGEECINKRDIAAITGWNFQTIQAHLQRYDFPYWRIPGKGRALYYRKSDVDKMLQPQKMTQKEAKE